MLEKIADFHQPITEVPKYIRQFFRPSGRRVAETLSRVMTCRLDTYMALGGILTIPALCGVPVNFSKVLFQPQDQAGCSTSSVHQIEM